MKTNFLIKIFLVAFSAVVLLSCGGSSSDGAGGDPDVDYTPDTFTVRFKLNGGVVGELGNTSDIVAIEIEPDTLLGALSRKPNPYNLDFSKTFVGWNTAADASGEYWTDDTAITENTILYAIYASEVAQNMSDIECNNPDVKYSISSDVEVSVPICAGPDEVFSGRFYGDGVTITVSGTDDYAGLFGKVKNAYISGVTVNAKTPRGNIAAGAIAAEADNSIIENITVSGTVRGNADGAIIGGVVGILKNGSVVSGSVSTAAFTFSGNSMSAGGIVGAVDGGSTVKASYHSGAIAAAASTTGEKIGGIAGDVINGTIENCYTETIINAASTDDTSFVGGIAGSVESGTINNSAAFGIMLSGNDAGRIAGSLAESESVEVTNSYAKSDMLVNFDAVSDSKKDGTGTAMVAVRKSQSFFKNTLGWDLDLAWQMPRHYEYPVPKWYETEPFIEIATFDELAAMKSEGNYILVADIDMTGKEWTPIVSFGGVLDGNGRTISNMNIVSDSDFGFINTLTGKVKNVTFASPVVMPEKSTSSMGFGTSWGQAHVSVVAATQSSTSSVIENVVVTDAEIGGGYLGGISLDAKGIITNCSVDANMDSDFTQGSDSYQGRIGGIARRLNSGAFILFSSYKGNMHFARPSDATSSYYGSPYLGGLAAEAYGTIVNSYADLAIDVTGAGHSGGLVATASAAQIINSYARANITVSDDHVYNSGNLPSITTGGLVGYVGSNTVIRNSAAFGESISADFINTVDVSDKVLNIGRLYGNLDATEYTEENNYVNGGMTLNPNDADTINMSTDPSTTTVPPAESFYFDSLGWNMTDVWTLPEGSDYPVLSWQ